MNTSIKKIILISVLLVFLFVFNHYIPDFNLIPLGVLVYLSAFSHVRLFIYFMNSDDDEYAADIGEIGLCLLFVNIYLIYLALKECGAIVLPFVLIISVTSIYLHVEYIKFERRISEDEDEDEENEINQNNENDEKKP